MNDLIARLAGVRQTAPGRWIAKCPAHDDRSPSLALRECDDGRRLLHCFAGCDVEEVLAAIGMTFCDLYPVRPMTGRIFYRPAHQTGISAHDALAMLDHESLVIAIIGADFLEHREIDEPTWTRLAQAVSKINTTRADCAPARMAR